MPSEPSQAQGAQGAQQQQIDITNMSLDQLAMLRRQMEEELEHLTESFEQLSAVHARFRESKATVGAYEKQTEGSDVLVPMTSSLYVRGKLSDANRVLVDIGTGYYVEVAPKYAEEHFGKKVKLLEAKINELRQVLMARRTDLDNVSQFAQMRMAQAQQAAGK